MVSQPTKATKSQDPPLVQWWIRVTSPARSSVRGSPNPQWREEVTSLFFPIVILLVLLPIPTAIGNPLQLATLIGVACIDIGALFLKRAGYLQISGIIILLTIESGLALTVLTVPGGFNATRLPLLDQLLQANMIAMAFFATWSVFVLALVNCAFVFYVMVFATHSLAFTKSLALDFSGIVAPVLTLQLFSAALGYIFIRTLIAAIDRADNAEKIAELEAIEIKRQEEQLATSKQIEEGIQQILGTLNHVVSQNDFTMRVPLKQENILWRVGRSINNLLSRLQGFKQSQEELKKTHAIAAEVAEHIRDGRPIQLGSWTGTAFDPVIIEYNKRFRNFPD